MKRFNVSILGVVAVLAIGLTAFTTSAPEAKTRTLNNCYRAVTTVLDASCASDARSIVLNAPCPSTTLVGLKVSGFGSFTSSISCDEVDNIFCCAQLIVDPAPCANQPKLNFTDASGAPQAAKPAKILDYECKSSI